MKKFAKVRERESILCEAGSELSAVWFFFTLKLHFLSFKTK